MTARPPPGTAGWLALALCVGATGLFGAIVLAATSARTQDDLLLPGLLTWSAGAALLAALAAVALTPRGLATYVSLAGLAVGLVATWGVGYAVGQNTMSACVAQRPPGPAPQDLVAFDHDLDLTSSSITCTWTDPGGTDAPWTYRVPVATALRGTWPVPTD